MKTLLSYLEYHFSVYSFKITEFKNYLYQSIYFQNKDELYKELAYVKNNKKLISVFQIYEVNGFINLELKYNQIEKIVSLYTQNEKINEHNLIDFIGTNFGKVIHWGHMRSIIMCLVLKKFTTLLWKYS